MKALLWCALIVLIPLAGAFVRTLWDEIVYMAKMEEW